MELKDIKVGKIYRIVGNHGGCSFTKCSNCEYFPNHLIKVTKVNEFDMFITSRKIAGTSLDDKNRCHFHHLDLVPNTWRDRWKK
jgi:hypothetical protein